jgi:Arc/MetJ-type ribon-helix-helix transcriptional regulator
MSFDEIDQFYGTLPAGGSLMTTTLSPETEALIHDRMKRAGYSTADEMVRIALDVLEQVEDQQIDDAEIVRIRESIQQMKRGELVDWKELSAPIRAKHFSR